MRQETFNGATMGYVQSGVALVLALAMALWAWLISLPGPLLFVVFLATFALTFFIIQQLRGGRRRKTEHFPLLDNPLSKGRSIEFYESRTAMLAARHGLEHELRGVSHAWVSLIAGTHFTTLSNEALKKIEKLILVDPESAFIHSLSQLPQYGEANLQFHLQAAMQRSQACKVPLKISPVPPLILTIGDPDTPQAWARVQIFLPYLPGSEQPNIVVYKSGQAKFFATLKTHFEEMWAHSRNYGERAASLTSIPKVSSSPTDPAALPYGVESPSSRVFLVQALRSQWWWEGKGGERHPLLADETIPAEARLLLQVYVRIEAPSLRVEEVRLVMRGESLPSDWMAMQLAAPHEQHVFFAIPRSLAPGKHRARIVVKSQTIERRSVLFEVEVPHLQ